MSTRQETGGAILAEDLIAMRSADRRLKAAKRALRAARAKQERRRIRIETAVQAYTEAARIVRDLQLGVQDAEHDYNHTVLRAAKRVLGET